MIACYIRLLRSVVSVTSLPKTKQGDTNIIEDTDGKWENYVNLDQECIRKSMQRNIIVVVKTSLSGFDITAAV